MQVWLLLWLPACLKSKDAAAADALCLTCWCSTDSMAFGHSNLSAHPSTAVSEQPASATCSRL
jgi:hypothetical protein